MSTGKQCAPHGTRSASYIHVYTSQKVTEPYASLCQTGNDSEDDEAPRRQSVRRRSSAAAAESAAAAAAAAGSFSVPAAAAAGSFSVPAGPAGFMAAQPGAGAAVSSPAALCRYTSDCILSM
jgi:hypothetical protein